MSPGIEHVKPHGVLIRQLQAQERGGLLESVVAVRATALPAADYDNGTGGVGATLTGYVNGAFPTADGVTLLPGNRVLIAGET